MKKSLQLSFKLAVMCVTAFSISCGGGDDRADPKVAGAGDGEGAGLPESLLVAAAPADAVSVVEARAKGKPGDAIILRGKVGGRMKPLSDAAAIFVLADEKAITSCDDNPDDECETPWDYCCEDPDTIKASIVTIQVRGADGKVVRAPIRGLGGLEELSHLVISGTVDETSTDDFMIVNATQIHVEKP